MNQSVKQRKSFFKKIELVVANIERFLICSSLASMVVLVFIQVIMRYIVKLPIMWVEELARYLSALIAFIGVSYVARKGNHIRMQLFVDMLPPRWKALNDIIVYLVCGGISLFLAYKSVSFLVWQNTLRSTSMGIPMSWLFATFSIGMLFAGIQYVVLIIQKIKLLAGGEEK